MFISRLKLENFKGFSSFDLDLLDYRSKRKAKNLILIYGENGIGKSSIIDAIGFVRKTVSSLTRLESITRLLATKPDNVSDDSDIVQFLRDNLSSNRISSLLKQRNRIGTTKPMRIIVKGELKERGPHYYYEMVFNKTNIIEEKLAFDDVVAFEYKTSLLINDDFIKSDEFKDKLRSTANIYFGEQSIMSCIDYIQANANNTFVKRNIPKEIRCFIDDIESIDVYSPNDNDTDIHSYTRSRELLPHISFGEYKDSYEAKKENTIKSLNAFFGSLYSNFYSVDYDIQTDKSNKKHYSLVFLEKNEENEIVRIPYQLESTGTKYLLTLFTYFYGAITTPSIILIDEIDTGLHDILLSNIIDSLYDEIKGQVILTTHNIILMKNNKLKKCCYILNREENGKITISSLDKQGRKIQSKTDMADHYLDGQYGGVPRRKVFSINDIRVKK